MTNSEFQELRRELTETLAQAEDELFLLKEQIVLLGEHENGDHDIRSHLLCPVC